MTYLMVLPSIHEPYTERCLSGWRGGPEHTLVVDNTSENRGVAASWNLGRRAVVEQQLDWLVVCSASMRFGLSGGLDFLQQLERSLGFDVVEAQWGWHLIGFSRSILQRVGEFDENFYPAYWEDIDYGYRIQLATGHHPRWPRCEVDAFCLGNGVHVQAAGIEIDTDRLLRYLETKWGSRHPQEKRWQHPFNDPERGVDYWPVAVR